MTSDDSEQSDLKALEESQNAWAAYEKSACNAIGRFFQGGSIQPGAVMECEMRLTRSRMKDLSELYDLPLRH